MLPESQIGSNIRSIRQAQGHSLEALAQMTGFSKGYLSKVENSDKAPPVSTLVVIAKALGVPLSQVFGEGQEKVTISLVNPDERKPMARNGTMFGYSYETLAHKYPNKRMEPYILTIKAGPQKSAVFHHRGEEMMMVLEGCMRFHIGGEDYLVQKGACIYFDSGIEHYGVAEGDVDLKILMVIYVPE